MLVLHNHTSNTNPLLPHNATMTGHWAMTTRKVKSLIISFAACPSNCGSVGECGPPCPERCCKRDVDESDDVPD